MTPFEYNGLQIHWRESGINTGKTIIWLHGFLENADMWNTILPFFSQKFHCIVINLPGHGSSPTKKGYSIKNIAFLMYKFIQEAEVENPYIVGHSMGGYVGLELKKIVPIQLTLLHSNFWSDSTQKKRDRNRVIELVKTKKDHFIQEALPTLFFIDNRTKSKSYIDDLILKAQKMSSASISDATAAMRDRTNNSAFIKDVTIINGEKDSIVPQSLFKKELEKLGQQPKVYTILNCGHMSIWEKPKQLINTLEIILIP